MTFDTSNAAWWSLRIIVLTAIAAAASLTALSSAAMEEPLLAAAAAFDLVISLPAAYYFSIRRSQIPKITVLPVFFASVAAASYIVGENGRFVVEFAAYYLIPAAELAVLVYVASRVFRIRRSYIADREPGPDMMERLRAAFESELKPAAVARAAAFEIGVLVIAFFRWRKGRKTDTFSYHKSSSIILAVFMFLLGAETFVLHTLLSQWNETAAWIVTAISAYFGIQIFAHFKAAILRPIVLTPDAILIRCGILGDAVVKLSDIRDVRAVRALESAAASTKLTPLGALTKPNVRLEVERETECFGPYGIAANFSRLEIFVDDPERFIASVKERSSAA